MLFVWLDLSVPWRFSFIFGKRILLFREHKNIFMHIKNDTDEKWEAKKHTHAHTHTHTHKYCIKSYEMTFEKHLQVINNK